VTDLPSFDLSGKVALVTGAARGLGEAIARALAHAGADVALGLRQVKSGAGLAREIERMGRRALSLQMDIRRLDEMRAAVAEARSHFGRIDILVNNVGIAPENLAENVTEADFDDTLAVNLKGTFFTSQAVGRVMMEQASGRIGTMGLQAADQCSEFLAQVIDWCDRGQRGRRHGILWV